MSSEGLANERRKRPTAGYLHETSLTKAVALQTRQVPAQQSKHLTTHEKKLGWLERQKRENSSNGNRERGQMNLEGWRMNEEANSRPHEVSHSTAHCLGCRASLQQTRTSAILAVLPPPICTSFMHNRVNTLY
jgi:hypothetical protein